MNRFFLRVVSVAVLVVNASALFAQSGITHLVPLARRISSSNYTVRWTQPKVIPTDSEMVIGSGSGHGHSIRWIRFLPDPSSVSVLEISFKDSHGPYTTKWGPDNAAVAVRSGKMGKSAYRKLLTQIAFLDSAILKEKQLSTFRGTSSDFWVATAITNRGNPLLSYDWAGYWASVDEHEFRKPELMVDVAEEAVKKLNMQDRELTTGERQWASEKFVKDIAVYDSRQFYWWVVEDSTVLIGYVGDSSALGALTSIMNRYGSAEERHIQRKAYYAINAITRITGKDLRSIPIEEMDVAKMANLVREYVGTQKLN